MKKTMLASVVVGVLLVSLVSAGLVPYLSNIVSGGVVVEGPVFYLSDTSAVVHDNSYNSLNLNEFDDNKDIISFTGSSERMQWLITTPLGINSFYDARYNFTINACAENNTLSDTEGQVNLDFYILHENGKRGDLICSTSFDIFTSDYCSGYSASNNYQLYYANCSSKDLSLDLEDRFMLILSDGALDIVYKISLDGKSKIKVTA